MGAGASSTGSRTNPVRTAVAEEPTKQAFTKPEKPLPKDGAILWLTSKSDTEILKGNIRNGAYGTLRITVPMGTDAYFIKLREISPGRGDVFGTIARPGRSVTVKVPLNGGERTTYRLSYGMGSRWYGREHAFGPSGMYSQAQDDFEFTEGSGWEVELIPQRGGNLGTSGLDYGSF